MQLNPLAWERSEQVLTWWDGQSMRDKLMLGFIVAVLTLGIAGVASMLMSSSIKSARASLSSVQSDMAKVQMSKATYDDKVGAVRQFEENLEEYRSFSLAGFVERMARELDINDQVGAINDKGIATEDRYDIQTINVIIRKISLRVVSDILYRIESAEQPIGISSTSIKADLKDRNLLTLNLTLTILKPKAPAQ